MPATFEFDTAFDALTGYPPFPWQRWLFDEWLSKGKLPSAVDIPTGLGKTAVMAIWLLARAEGAPLPRRLVYVVDRRAVVDQATTFAVTLRNKLTCEELAPVRRGLGLDDDRPLPISTLRGQHVDNREWMDDPSAPAVVVGTVDMVGSRLLFSGYGVSRRMRPYVAGLLGCDTLVMLDEAHLAQPFHRLLRSIEEKRPEFSGPAANRELPPPFRMLPLSATLSGGSEPKPFRLDAEDERNGTVRARLNAAKTLTMESLEEGGKLEDALTERAWRLASDAAGSVGKPIRVLVYCDWRTVAEKVEKNLRKRIKEAKTGAETVLFVGGRRVREREEAAEELRRKGLIAGNDAEPDTSVFLVATAAGEVGVDLDADHMVCDLVAWERMVQRLGRVNRRGAGAAQVLAIDQGPPKESDKDETAFHEAVRKLLKDLPSAETGGLDASPAALDRLQREAGRGRIEEASTPMPLYPALSRPLVDAWALTSLVEHTGRPEVAPWLRGWADNEPQTTVAWRYCLPLRFESGGGHAPVEAPEREIEAFFEAAPLQVSELLETETRLVVDWLKNRTGKLLKAWREPTETDISADDAEGFGLLRPLRRDAPVAFLLDSGGKPEGRLGLENLRAQDLRRRLVGRTLVMDARFGGIENGLLDDGHDVPASTIENNWGDPGAPREEQPTIRVRPVRGGDPAEREEPWRETFKIPYLISPEGDAEIWLVVEKRADAVIDEESRAMVSKPQLLDEHQAWVADEAMRIAKEIGLSDGDGAMLAAAAHHHDDGKAALRWQRAFNAHRESGPHAKTAGPFNRHILNGYRHEFGSVLDAQRDGFDGIERFDPRFELALHLIAAHHGNARPAIGIEGCDALPPTAAAREAHEIATRFARLQCRWGPWGLAWWEALLRAADRRASKRLEEEAGRRQTGATESAVPESIAQRDLFAPGEKETA